MANVLTSHAHPPPQTKSITYDDARIIRNTRHGFLFHFFPPVDSQIQVQHDQVCLDNSSQIFQSTINSPYDWHSYYCLSFVVDR